MKRLFVLSTIILFIISCGEKVREETTERYDDGKPKTIMKFRGEGSEEVMIEKISYGSKGDTLFWEKPLEDFYYEKVREVITERYDNGQKSSEVTYKDGKSTSSSSSGESENKYYNVSGGSSSSSISTCKTCGISYTVAILPYGKYCSKRCCVAYEGMSSEFR